MAFLKVLRDSRGYEHFYLIEPFTGRRGRVRERLLYWFRTPPNIRVGRQPLDPAVQKALERQYPDVTFDWAALGEAAVPPPGAGVESWRDRRRAERAARRPTQARSRQEAAQVETADEAARSEVVSGPTPAEPLEAALPVGAPASSGAVDELPVDEGVSRPPARRRRRRRMPREGSGGSPAES